MQWSDCTVIIFTAVMQMAGLSNMLWLFVFCSNVQGDSQTSICITIEPGLLLKGDILVRMGEILGHFAQQPHYCSVFETQKQRILFIRLTSNLVSLILRPL